MARNVSAKPEADIYLRLVIRFCVGLDQSAKTA